MCCPQIPHVNVIKKFLRYRCCGKLSKSVQMFYAFLVKNVLSKQHLSMFKTFFFLRHGYCGKLSKSVCPGNILCFTFVKMCCPKIPHVNVIKLFSSAQILRQIKQECLSKAKFYVLLL
jgi:hypothetical protein